uniref:DJ-1/PfpI domain-containing protein n=1 Tax=Aegilops tauschii subsp. strangulata TaxID=200361 RepID=A0A453QKK1_AEGTS
CSKVNMCAFACCAVLLLAKLICFCFLCPVFFFCNVLSLDIVQGGPAGAERLHRSTTLKKLLKEQKQAGRMYGGISYSPLILQKQGLLEDKTVTAHPSIVSQLTCQVIDSSKVVIDGNLITGKGLGTVMDFSLAIVRKFFGHGRAKGVANGMVFDYPKSRNA